MNTPEKTPNTITGKYVSIENGVYIIRAKENRQWHIPKALRHLKLKKGDFVYVKNWGHTEIRLVRVYNVFREEIENTGRSYPPVTAKVKETKKSPLVRQ